MNVLLKPFQTEYGAVPFSKIKNEDFLPAVQESIRFTNAEIHTIVENSDEPTIENTLDKFDLVQVSVEHLKSIFGNLLTAETNDALDSLAEEILPLLSDFENEIMFNSKLFQKIKKLYDKKETLNLDTEQEMFLRETYLSFMRNGALLSSEQQQQLKNIDTNLSKLQLAFDKNVLADHNSFSLHLTRESQLEGIPSEIREAAAELAQNKNQEGWVFTLDYPSYSPFMKFSQHRALRKEMFIAFGKKGYDHNKNNNEEITIQIARLREKRAKLLGYQSYAHFVLEERMVQQPEDVLTFLNELLRKAMPAAKKEYADLEKFAREKDGIDHLEKWDIAYYANLLKQELFDLDDQILKPYFKLENVLDGVFKVAHTLYGLSFYEINTIDKYHEEIKTFKVMDSNDHFVALFYADFFPRKGKKSGAWMTNFKDQYKKDGINERPHISIVCNFMRPTATKPSLLTFDEVTTLFHEFGHSLHGMLANTTYQSLSGTSVLWDFVELPSQILENWCYEPEALTLFATHYETGEMIPMEYIQKIKNSANFLEGMATIRQLSLCFLDMGWHYGDLSTITDLKTFEKKLLSSTNLSPEVEDVAISTSFSHIFNGGYAAGYYSYKWAEMLDADAFEYFKENGIFNKEIAKKFYENILSKGGTEHPAILYKRFRGKEPTIDALLKRAGLLGK